MVSMSGLEEVLARAQATLKSGSLQSEAHVRQAVIGPVLQALGWDPTDARQWIPEMRVPEGVVDDALLGDNGNPLVFVEAKRQGNLSPKAEEQLFDYAAKQGVPLLVLTDGDIWDLYLSMAAGPPTQRQFLHIELTNRNTDVREAAEDFTVFLERAAVLSQKANFAAQGRLAEVNNRLKGKQGLASAWLSLLRERGDPLRELLVNRVVERTGSRPWTEDVDSFLTEQVNKQDSAMDSASQSADALAWLRAAPPTLTAGMKAAVTRWFKQLDDAGTAAPPPGGPGPEPLPGLGILRGFRIQGRSQDATSGRETLTLLASALEQHTSGFLDRWADSGRPNAARRRAVRGGDARLQSDVLKSGYRSVEEFPQWHLWVHGSTATKLKLMQRMTELAGLQWGNDIEPILEDPIG